MRGVDFDPSQSADITGLSIRQLFDSASRLPICFNEQLAEREGLVFRQSAIDHVEPADAFVRRDFGDSETAAAMLEIQRMLLSPAKDVPGSSLGPRDSEAVAGEADRGLGELRYCSRAVALRGCRPNRSSF
jgi:hypothetical protein